MKTSLDLSTKSASELIERLREKEQIIAMLVLSIIFSVIASLSVGFAIGYTSSYAASQIQRVK